ncbi:MAG: hypothetical protein ACYC75_03625 [Minisyncoccota bacterium]
MKSPFFHIIIAGSVCIILMIGYGIAYAGVEAESVTVANLESQITAKTETASRDASTRASLDEIASDEATMQSYFVPETGVVSFIDNLQTQAKTLGATTTVLSVSLSGTGTQQAVLEVALIVKGTFDSVMRAVGAIEYAPYDLSIPAFALKQDDKNAWEADLNIAVGSVSANAATSTP